ncbi:MAG: hypothetical protein HY908_15205 [Myxococcales bacterium]|nr:hypothetical protein [Myxococcales bacterium]
MPNLTALRGVWGVFAAVAPESGKQASEHPQATAGYAELERAVAGLSEETRARIRLRCQEAAARLRAAEQDQERASVLATAIQDMAALAKNSDVARLVAESVEPSRIGELTPSHGALVTAFARGTAAAIEAARAAGLPVHALRDGKVVRVAPAGK